MRTFSLRLPDVGVAAAPGVLRGYVTPQQSGVLRMRVASPAGRHGRVVAFAGRARVASSRSGGDVVFTLPTRAGRPADWAVVADR
jgi:hypothetical protein